MQWGVQRQSTKNTELGLVAGTPEGWAAVQRDHGRLEKWAEKNLVGSAEGIPFGRS